MVFQSLGRYFADMFDAELQKHYDEVAEKPDRFGFVLSAVLFVIAFSVKHSIVSFIYYDVGFLLFLSSALFPEVLIPIQRLFQKMGFIMGKWVSPLFMGMLYFLVITPLALLRKLLTKKQSNSTSYFQASGNEHLEPDYFERPF